MGHVGPHAADRDGAGRLPRPGPHRASARSASRATRSRSRRPAASRSCSRRSRPRWPSALMERMEIPVIGIGAGPATDGQVLVFHDLLGHPRRPGARFVKRYAELKTRWSRRARVRRGRAHAPLPGPEHTYSIDPGRAGGAPLAARRGLAATADRVPERRHLSQRTYTGTRPPEASGAAARSHTADRRSASCRACRRSSCPATASSSTSSRRRRPTSCAPPTCSTRCCADYPEHAGLARDILICEQEGDRITHDIIQRLNQTFVTPIDREDIHAARLRARRHRRLHRGGRRLPRPLQDRGADGAGAAPGAHPAPGRAPDRRGDAAAARLQGHLALHRRDQPARERRRPRQRARRSPRCSTTASTRWS